VVTAVVTVADVGAVGRGAVDLVVGMEAVAIEVMETVSRSCIHNHSGHTRRYCKGSCHIWYHPHNIASHR